MHRNRLFFRSGNRISSYIKLLYIYTHQQIPSKHIDTLIHRVHNYKNQINRSEFEIGYIWSGIRVSKTNQLQFKLLDDRVLMEKNAEMKHLNRVFYHYFEAFFHCFWIAVFLKQTFYGNKTQIFTCFLFIKKNIKEDVPQIRSPSCLYVFSCLLDLIEMCIIWKKRIVRALD